MKYLLIVTIFMVLCSSGCKKPPINVSREIQVSAYDTLAKHEVHAVRINARASVDRMSSDDLKEICAAVGRTPSIEYEIFSIKTFPFETAFAARVEVDGKLLLLCRMQDGKWHVLQTLDFHR